MNSNNTITIECINLSKHFGVGSTLVTPLQDIDLVVRRGEMVMLVGPSGSGKTTLISIIAGMMQQSSGQCLVLGQSINDLKEEEKIAFRGKNIGFIFQKFTLVHTLTALENVAVQLLLNGHTRQEAFAKASDLLLSIGLDQQRYRTPQNLSGGEQQRVAIARACIHQPKIILCDEPTSYLDYDRGIKIMELLQQIKAEQNCTLIVVTHDPRIFQFADRILELDKGRLQENGIEKYKHMTRH
jgi:putative ABC transport system ATP-binding protein